MRIAEERAKTVTPAEVDERGAVVVRKPANFPGGRRRSDPQPHAASPVRLDTHDEAPEQPVGHTEGGKAGGAGHGRAYADDRPFLAEPQRAFGELADGADPGQTVGLAVGSRSFAIELDHTL